jgi:hypothetical protein
MKKNIIFIFTGTARSSPFSLITENRHMEILDIYNTYLFTDEFKSLYNYKIYISTDNINLEDAINYFSLENIGNIHLHDTDFYLKNVEKKIEPVEYFLNIFNQQHDEKYIKWTNSIYQFHKILCSYNLFRSDNIKDCDYIIRLRMDIGISQNILEIIDLFNKNPELELCMSSDHFAIGKPNIMNCYCSGLENNYGNYKNNTIVPDILPIFADYKTLDMYVWMYAPERQLFEMLFEYCIKNELDINKAIIHYHFAYVVRIRDEVAGWQLGENK